MQLELENSKLEFESSLKEKEEKILSDAIHAAQEKAQTILENSKAEIEKNRIEFDTDRRNKSEDLERYIKNTLQEAEQNKNKILEEAEDRKKILLEEAQKAIDELNSENIKIAQDIIAKAKREAIESAEKERQIIIEQALVDAKSKGEAEVERILKQNEVKISTQTAEIEKLEETSQKLVHEQERKIRLIKEDAEREISTKRHELELQSEKLNLDIEKRTSEFEETYEKKKNQSEEELSRLENEIKYNKEHLQVILNKRNDELDAIFKKHQLSLERAAIEKEKDLKSKLDKDLKSKRLELADIEENIKIKNKQINESMGEIETLDNQLRKAKETLNSKTVEIEKAERTFDELQERTNEQQSNLSESIKAKEEIEKRAAALKLELEEVKSQLEDLRKRKSVEGEKVEQEIRKKMDGLIKEREKQIQEEFSLEQKKIDHYREKWKKELNDNKQRLLTSLVDQSTRYFSNSIDSKNLKTAQTELEEKLKLVLDQEIASSALLAEEQKATKSITHKKKGYKGNREVIHGFIAGALVVTCFFVVKASLESKSVSALVDLEQKNRADDLAARQFRPEQTSEVKENYTDAVIYTKDFTSLYLDNDVQNRWAKQAKDYFFENWRVPEETVIEVVSKAKVLVQNLKEKRENIHPDFVDKNIEKMRQFEADEVKALKEKLGTNVKFEAFKKLETRFFTNEMAKRQPATQDSN